MGSLLPLLLAVFRCWLLVVVGVLLVVFAESPGDLYWRLSVLPFWWFMVSALGVLYRPHPIALFAF